MFPITTFPPPRMRQHKIVTVIATTLVVSQWIAVCISGRIGNQSPWARFPTMMLFSTATSLPELSQLTHTMHGNVMWEWPVALWTIQVHASTTQSHLNEDNWQAHCWTGGGSVTYMYCMQQHYACIVHLVLRKWSTKLVGSDSHRERIVSHYSEIKTPYQEDTYT